ncbi:MAG TPA: Stk1 family PASTA domain-containing Ser/Thr kinase [Pseudonocardiaceae bacterium]|nr:Stk1 family PASTA domain-containing Ser/Thr kinase [Pseudonocardiaceae bacterium]
MEANGVAVLGAVLEGRYRVEKPLARGGMSNVYAGLDLRLDRPVAIKVMEAKFAQDRSFIDRFELEARAAARLHHPNVVAVHDQGVDGDHVYLVMELVSGGTLRDLLRERGALPVPLAVSVLDPVLAALTSAHRAGLVHRDVKPENVLIGQGGVVKVADFGLVRAIATAGVTSDSTILGTVAYLSPEQVETGAADARSDVYAAGIVCYEMLTGAPPFTGDTPLSVAYRHVNDDVPPPSESIPGIPAALDDLVLRATRRDPALRPADAAAFLDELVRTRNSLGLHRVPVPVPTPVPLAMPADPAPGSARGRHRADDSSTVLPLPTAEETTTDESGGERTEQVSSSAVATHVVPSGSLDRTTVRTPPVRPGPIGPQGTRALSREDYRGQAVAVDPYPPARRTEPAKTPRSPYEAQRVKARRTMMIWVVVVLVLAAVLGVAAWWFGSGRWTAVPRIGGLDPTTAERTLQDADLSGAITQAHSNTVPAGQVVSTSPAVGARALRGSTITVVISEGKPIVPDITPGASPSAVEQAVKSAELTPRLDPAQDAYSPTVPKGAVVGLNPGPGTQLNIGSPVVVVVSKGPPPNPVPNVVGQPHDQAFQALQQAGFLPFDEPATFDPNVGGGTVIKTDPAAGATGVPGNKVGVEVSNAVTLPSVTGQPAQQAQQTLQGLGLQVQIQALANDPTGQVFVESPSAGSLVAPGTVVTLGVFP